MHDNNLGYQYRVSFNTRLIGSSSSTPLSFQYGNDIDNTIVVDEQIEVLAQAQSEAPGCTQSRPVITRRIK